MFEGPFGTPNIPHEYIDLVFVNNRINLITSVTCAFTTKPYYHHCNYYACHKCSLLSSWSLKVQPCIQPGLCDDANHVNFMYVNGILRTNMLPASLSSDHLQRVHLPNLKKGTKRLRTYCLAYKSVHVLGETLCKIWNKISYQQFPQELQ